MHPVLQKANGIKTYQNWVGSLGHLVRFHLNPLWPLALRSTRRRSFEQHLSWEQDLKCSSDCSTNQRKFRSSNFRLYWKLPVDLTAEMFWRVGIARNAVFFHSFVASKARKGRSEKRELRRIGCPRCLQNLHHACARERFGSQNR